MKKTNKQPKNQSLRELVESEDLKAVKSYLKATPKEIVLQKDRDGRDALYYAIFTGNLSLIKTLIKYGFEPANIDKKTGATALHLASSEGLCDLVVYLLDSVKMDVNALDKEGKNALYYALMFLNKNKPNEKMDCCTNNLIAASELVSYGAEFQDSMFGMQLELEYFETALLHLIHNGMKNLDNPHLVRNMNRIEFLQEVLYSYLIFFNTISTNCKPFSVCSTSELEKTQPKIPLVFGYKISTWDLTDRKKQRLIALPKQEIETKVYDLAAMAPLLIIPGDTILETHLFFYHFVKSLRNNFEPTDVKLINIATEPYYAFTKSTEDYFTQSTVTSEKEALQIIEFLYNEVNRRKKLPKSKLKKELPVICWFDDLSQITNKTAIANLQNIAFFGKDVGVYLIAVSRGDLPDIIRGHFSSIVIFHTATATESKKYLGHPNATELKMNEMLVHSFFIKDLKPVHIKMENMVY